MRIRRWFAVVLLLGIILSTVNQADATGNIHLGRMQVDPFISISEIFDNNIYSTSSDQKRDTITSLTPGIKLDRSLGRNEFHAEYYAVLRRYKTYRGEATTDHHANADLDLKFGGSLGLNLRDVYAKDHEPRWSSATGFIEVYRKNSASAAATYQLADRSKVEFDYSQSAYNFQTSSFRDRDETLASAYLYYRFLPKTSAFVEYERLSVDYLPVTTPLDNTEHSVLLGVTWQATSKSKGTIKLGKTWKDFREQMLRDFSVWTWSVDVKHYFTEYTSLVLVGSRGVNEANLFGTSYFITTGASSEFSHSLTYKLSIMLRGAYGRDVFSNAVPPSTVVREDKTTAVGAGVKYTMQDWIEFGVDYNATTRDSNLAGFSFRDHQYLVSAYVLF